MNHYDRNDRVIWQEMGAIKKWAERSVKPSNKQISAPKESGKSKSSSHKRSKNERQVVQASLQTTANERATDRFWTFMEGRHAQGLNLTNLYPANTGHSEVMGQK